MYSGFPAGGLYITSVKITCPAWREAVRKKSGTRKELGARTGRRGEEVN
jgi:hypothetical protein